MKIPCMVEEVHAKFGWISLLVKGEMLPAKGVLAKGDNVHAFCAVMVDGRYVPNDKGDGFNEEEVVFPRSEFIVKSKAGDDITEEFLKFTQTLVEQP